METRLSDEEDSALFEPAEHPHRQRSDFVVVEVHEQPVGEDDVILVAFKFQFRHIRLQEANVLVVSVALPIPLHVTLHEVDGRQVRRRFGQVIRESPSSKFYFIFIEITSLSYANYPIPEPSSSTLFPSTSGR